MTQALPPPTKLGIDDLCRLAGLTRRTVRFYIQKGLLDKPSGEKKGAWYSQEHLERLARIRQFSSTGLSLDAVARELDGGATDGLTISKAREWNLITLRPTSGRYQAFRAVTTEANSSRGIER